MTALWAIPALAALGVMVRPFGWPEWVWAVAGAVVLVGAGLPPAMALTGVLRGTDVYCFLIGMMLLAELARQEGLFDHLAARAARLARGSAARLFTLVYGVGVGVTVFLSNDATAVVLTPAVMAVTRAAKVRDGLPYLFICAFVANAASFVLPVSNPANLVIYGSEMPPLLDWLHRYALPSVLAIGATYAMLRWMQRASLREPIGMTDEAAPLSRGGWLAAIGLGGAACVLLTASALGLKLGTPTLGAGILAMALVAAFSPSPGWTALRGVSWGVLPLVAGLFVMVEALEVAGFATWLAGELRRFATASEGGAVWLVGPGLALASNAVNNLPAGLLAGRVVALAEVPERVRAAVLIAIDLGPNLSVTGSLATLLWLQSLRREGVVVGAWQFLRLGLWVMPVALLLALGAVWGGP